MRFSNMFPIARNPGFRFLNKIVVLLPALVIGMTAPQPAAAEEHLAGTPLKIGLVSFFSGSVSGPVGIPSRNGALVAINAINAGALPKPYANTGKGAGGRKIEAIFSDEAVDAAARVSEYRNLVQRRGADVIIGYASSGSCLAVAPAAEELKTLTLFYYCGSTRIFEEEDREFIFRTMATQDVENIAAARYILSLNPDVKKISGMNQNYAWGQDSWRDFVSTLKTLKPEMEIITEQFPKIFSGQYGAEVTALLRADADVVHSSFWGGDMEAFILQGAARGLFEDQTVILTTGGTAVRRLASQIPEGTIIGVRGTGDMFAPESELNDWFRKAYNEQFGEDPTFPAYYMAQSVFALKAAADKAAEKAGRSPSADEIRISLKGLTFESPAGTVKMARANGHQAVTDVAYGTFALRHGKPVMENVKYYSSECVNAPSGTKSRDWIKAGFPGSKCD